VALGDSTGSARGFDRLPRAVLAVPKSSRPARLRMAARQRLRRVGEPPPRGAAKPRPPVAGGDDERRHRRWGNDAGKYPTGSVRAVWAKCAAARSDDAADDERGWDDPLLPHLPPHGLRSGRSPSAELRPPRAGHEQLLGPRDSSGFNLLYVRELASVPASSRWRATRTKRAFPRWLGDPP